ncbi:polyprotein [Fusarium sambucinum hypovirus 1]|uniref:Polyprotein n=1 Tax=Fusarium sambucinum hypovirus 1 TaxID=2801155 RepID=A0ABM7MU32_9VIRU|nr:polyprotein [Fusarium sambucinum hypovirus 1]BCP96869.1 polyprotein [Fusarium sambucinum hypovirus 1]
MAYANESFDLSHFLSRQSSVPSLDGDQSLALHVSRLPLAVFSEHFIEPALRRDKANPLMRQSLYPCHCRIHFVPPSIREAEDRNDQKSIGRLLCRLPTSGPLCDAGWNVVRPCARTVQRNRKDALIAQAILKGKFREAVKVKELPDYLSVLAEEDGMIRNTQTPDLCYHVAFREKFQKSIVNLLSYRCLVKDFVQALTVFGKKENYPMQLVQVDGDLYHLYVHTTGKWSKNSGEELLRQATFIANGAPGARVGFQFGKGGFTAGNQGFAMEGRKAPRGGMGVAWAQVAKPTSSPTSYHELPTLTASDKPVVLQPAWASRRDGERKLMRKVENCLHSLRAEGIALRRLRRSLMFSAKIAIARAPNPRSWKEGNRFAGLDGVPRWNGVDPNWVPPPVDRAKRRKTGGPFGRKATSAAGERSRILQLGRIAHKKKMKVLAAHHPCRSPRITPADSPVGRGFTADHWIGAAMVLTLDHPSTAGFKSRVLALKRNVDCPTAFGVRLNYKSRNDRVFLTSYSSSVEVGVEVILDDLVISHFGKDPVGTPDYRKLSIVWKLRACAALYKAQKERPNVRGKGKEIIESYTSAIRVKVPSWYRSLQGFKIGAWLGQMPVYSRSARFSIGYEDDPSRGLFTPANKKMFNAYAKDMRFTSLGLAKLWIDLGNRLDWKNWMARQLSTHRAALDAEMRHIYETYPSGPDVVIEKIRDSPLAKSLARVIHHVEEVIVNVPADPLLEKPVGDKRVKFQSPNVNVRPDMANQKRIVFAPRRMALGSIPTDYVFIPTTLAQCGDVEPNPGPRPTVIVDPATPLSGECASDWMASFYGNDHQLVSPEQALKSVICDWESSGEVSKLPYVPALLGEEHVYNRSARNKLNIAPTSRAFGKFVTLGRQTKRRTRQNVEFPAEWFESAEHDKANEPTDFVVEKNPGPVSRPGTPDAEDRGRKRSDTGLSVDTSIASSSKGKERERSRTMDFLGRVMTSLHINSDDLIRLKRYLGFSGSNMDVCEKLGLPEDSMLMQRYTKHLVIGHLPSNKEYSEKWRIPLWSSLFESEDQYVLDRNFHATVAFNLSHTSELPAIINRFFQTLSEEKIGRREMAALAQHVKSSFKCPNSSLGVALQVITGDDHEIVIHWTNTPTNEEAGKIWYYVNQTRYLHGGTDDEHYVGDNESFLVHQLDEVKQADIPEVLFWNFQLPPRSVLRSLQEEINNHQMLIRPKMDFENFGLVADKLDELCIRFGLGTNPLIALQRVVYGLMSSFSCPDHAGYLLVINSNSYEFKMVKLHQLDELTRDRCWLVIDGKLTVHFGTEVNMELTRARRNERPSFRLSWDMANEMWIHHMEMDCRQTSLFQEAAEGIYVLNPSRYVQLVTCFIISIWIWLKLWFEMVHTHTHPDLSSPAYPPNPDDDDPGCNDPDQDRSNDLVIVTMGTTGDTKPVGLLKRVPEMYGVKSRIVNQKTMDGNDMELLRKGSVWSFMIDYSGLTLNDFAGAKALLVPHVEIPPSSGLSYTLSPGSKYIHPVKFVDDWSKVDPWDYIPAKAMELFQTVFKPAIHIGSLKKSSNFPRTVDGLNYLKKKTNLDVDKKRPGWTSGSNNPEVIPKAIRDSCERIPDGDHSEIFRNYHKIFMHGGAGTVQTAIACGCEVVICDPTMDRNYHTLPTPDDFYNPGISTLMGYLVLRGFDIKVPIEVKFFWVLGFLWNTKAWCFLQLLDILARVIALLSCMNKIWQFAMALYISIPLILWRVALSKRSFTQIIWMSIGLLWEFPVLALEPSLSSFGLISWMLRRHWTTFLSDFHSIMRPRFYLEFEPAKHKHGYFPMPFGHYSILDTDSQYRYEGQFISGKGHSIGSEFRFTRNKRKISSWVGYLAFPVPFNLFLANKWLSEGKTGCYSSSHNCLTLSKKLIGSRSIFWWVTLNLLNCLVWLALQPPATLSWVLELFGITEFENSVFYSSLGFAASIEGIPLTIDDEIDEEASLPASPALTEPGAQEEPLPDLRDLQFIDIIEQTSKVVNSLARPGHILENYSEKEKVSVVEESVVAMMNNMEFPDDDYARINLDGYVPRKVWSEIVDAIHHAFGCLRQDRVLDAFISWLHGIGEKVREFIQPILNLLTIGLQYCYLMGIDYFRTMLKAGSDLISYAYGLEESKRYKTVWGLTGLHKTGVLSVKAKIAMMAAHAEFRGRSNNPLDDFNHLVDKINTIAESLGVGDPSTVGGVQARKINFNNQLMTKREADLIGWGPGEYKTDPIFEQMVQKKIDSGAVQATDGVRLAKHFPEKISQSIDRYEPKYAALLPDKKGLAQQVAQSLFDDFPSVFSNCEVTPPKSIFNYLKPKVKYSPGIPFMGENGYKTRKAMNAAGYLKVLEVAALANIKNGEVEPEFLHDFGKSQMVPAEVMLKPDPRFPARKGKDMRTVTAQDPLSYVVAQVVSMERNKRSWEPMGVGTGMRLNQSMGKYYEELELFCETLGGGYFKADCKAFDSTEGPFCEEVNKHLAYLGYKDHWSGNGAALASIMQASFDAQSNSWNIGITKARHSCLTATIGDPAVRTSMARLAAGHVLDTTDLTKEEIHDLIESGETLGKILLVHGKHDPKLPSDAHHLGVYQIGDPEKDKSKAFKVQHFIYEDKSCIRPTKSSKAVPRAMLNDFVTLASAPFALVSSFHAKNRGGGTGKWDTTVYNTISIHGLFRAAWSTMFNRPPSEFRKYVNMKSTGDDMMVASGGKYGLNSLQDVIKFKRIIEEYGIHLEVDWTDDITEVEYLSKYPRRPTPEDSADLRVWRNVRIQEVLHRAQQLGLDTTKLDFSLFDNPKWLVVQQIDHLKMRGTGLRYYQAHPATFLDVVAKRAAGHALNTAFELDAWKHFAGEWTYCVNRMCEKQNIHHKYVVNESRGPRHLPRIEQIDPRAKIQKLSPRQLAFLRDLKGMMYPSYLKVLQVHMNTAEMDPEKHDKLFRKLERTWRGPHEIVSETVDYLYSLTDRIPDDYRKFTPGPAIQYAERSFYTQNFVCERFVWQCLLRHNQWEDITYGIFIDACNKGPYACAMDPYGFYAKCQQQAYREKVESENFWMTQGLVFWITAIYAVTPYIEAIILGLWFIGPVYKLWMWSFFGLSKVYGLLNTLYWHAEGTSSAEISRQMPKDPYVVSKRFCVFIVDLLPDFLGLAMLLPVGCCRLIPEGLEALAKVNFKASQMKYPPTNNNPVENPWSRYADEIIDATREPGLMTATLSAPPATGKTSYNVAALYAARHAKGLRHIVIVSPTIALRNQVSLPFGIKVKVIERGVEWSDQDVVLSCTYGHFFQSVRAKLTTHDLAVFDEFHKQTEPMIASLDRRANYSTLLMSATPAKIAGLEDMKTIRPDIQPRYKNKIRKCPDTMPTIDMFQLAMRENPKLFEVVHPRVLIVVATIKAQTNLIEQLTSLLPRGTMVSRFSRHHKILPDHGIIVSTQYIDAGTDIKGEYPTLMIDCGKRVLIDRNKFIHPLPWTDYDTNKQRIHRVGRNSPGIVYQPESSGTGPKGVEYTAPSYMQYKHVAKHFGVNALGKARRPACRTLPWLEFNPDVDLSISEKKSIAILHAFAYAGLEGGQWESMYGRIQNHFQLGSEHDYLLRTVDDWQWKSTKIINWDKVLDLFNTENITITYFESQTGSKWTRYGRPFKLIGHLWDQMDPHLGVDSQSTGHDLNMDQPTQWKDYADSLKSLRSGLQRYVKDMSPAMVNLVDQALFV